MIMFSGLIQAIGAVQSIQRHTADLRLGVDAPDLPLAEVALGESVAVNGVCLTVVERGSSGFFADVSAETLRLTTLDDLQIGSLVNLERCLSLSTLIGGHLVSGHVDGLGELVAIRTSGTSKEMRFCVPQALARYLAPKGSVCVDGMSLTINQVEGAQFVVNLIPHTLTHTVAGHYSTGQRVNIEVDLIARYIERLLTAARPPAQERNS